MYIYMYIYVFIFPNSTWVNDPKVVPYGLMIMCSKRFDIYMYIDIYIHSHITEINIRLGLPTPILHSKH